jgi:hypothetical protein
MAWPPVVAEFTPDRSWWKSSKKGELRMAAKKKAAKKKAAPKKAAKKPAKKKAAAKKKK